MQIKLGYEIKFYHPQYTPLILKLNIHSSRVSDLVVPDVMQVSPALAIGQYRDSFGNLATRLIAPPGEIVLSTDGLILDTGYPDPVDYNAVQHGVSELPLECLDYIMGSRYCETDKMMDIAFQNFGHIVGGWNLVQAICDFAHNQITFDYQQARRTRTAYEAYIERVGVCRDYTHLAVTLCRCMNIPARYCTGYLGDIGVPKDPAPMDFSAWFEAYIGGRWYTFDPRHNKPRIGHILIAYGRDATDTAISSHFGTSVLNSFRVWTDEVTP